VSAGEPYAPSAVLSAALDANAAGLEARRYAARELLAAADVADAGCRINGEYLRRLAHRLDPPDDAEGGG